MVLWAEINDFHHEIISLLRSEGKSSRTLYIGKNFIVVSRIENSHGKRLLLTAHRPCDIRELRDIVNKHKYDHELFQAWHDGKYLIEERLPLEYYIEHDKNYIRTNPTDDDGIYSFDLDKYLNISPDARISHLDWSNLEFYTRVDQITEFSFELDIIKIFGIFLEICEIEGKAARYVFQE